MITRPEGWRWTAMIMQPDHITPKMYSDAIDKVRKKLHGPTLEHLRMEVCYEGLCIQIMHIGPYSEEHGTLARMEAFAQENGYIYHGKHHEIYLGDPRRSDPSKLKTILHHPVEKQTRKPI